MEDKEIIKVKKLFTYWAANKLVEQEIKKIFSKDLKNIFSYTKDVEEKIKKIERKIESIEAITPEAREHLYKFFMLATTLSHMSANFFIDCSSCMWSKEIEKSNHDSEDIIDINPKKPNGLCPHMDLYQKAVWCPDYKPMEHLINKVDCLGRNKGHMAFSLSMWEESLKTFKKYMERVL